MPLEGDGEDNYRGGEDMTKILDSKPVGPSSSSNWNLIMGRGMLSPGGVGMSIAVAGRHLKWPLMSQETLRECKEKGGTKATDRITHCKQWEQWEKSIRYTLLHTKVMMNAEWISNDTL